MLPYSYVPGARFLPTAAGPWLERFEIAAEAFGFKLRLAQIF
jgi:hypothetical protein